MGFNELFIKELKESGIGLIKFNPCDEAINFIIESEKMITAGFLILNYYAPDCTIISITDNNYLDK